MGSTLPCGVSAHRFFELLSGLLAAHFGVALCDLLQAAVRGQGCAVVQNVVEQAVDHLVLRLDLPGNSGLDRLLALAQRLRAVDLVFRRVGNGAGVFDAPGNVLQSSSITGCVRASAASLRPSRCVAVIAYPSAFPCPASSAYTFCRMAARSSSVSHGRSNFHASAKFRAQHSLLHHGQPVGPFLVGVVQNAVAPRHVLKPLCPRPCRRTGGTPAPAGRPGAARPAKRHSKGSGTQ